MSEDFTRIVAETRAWFETTREAGWISDVDFERFEHLEHAAPGDLFVDAETRPLVVAFFGGTGVGKSSLLNRLAGESIARTGVERPTSREITLYLYSAVELAAFPETLPIEKVQIRRHENPARRGVCWIDMPDIDSTELDNRRETLSWLPHIDLLIYVVSPERYRDDAGWRVLLDRHARHGWMFVMNRWDEGDPRQRSDFARMLREAGFDDPLVLATSCTNSPKLPTEDEFTRIEATINDVLAAHGLKELERLGRRARLHELRAALTHAMQQLGDEKLWDELDGVASDHLRATPPMMLEGLAWPMRGLAGRVAAREKAVNASLLEQAASAVVGRTREAEPDAPPKPSQTEFAHLAQSLWDEWADAKLLSRIDLIETEARSRGVEAQGLRLRMDIVAGEARGVVLAALQDATRRSLAQPGSPLRRAARRVTGFLVSALPLSALGWTGLNLLIAYWNASRGQGSVPGVDWVVGSLAVIGLAWAAPFMLDRMLQPSMQAVVLRALREGVSVGLGGVLTSLEAAFDEARADADARRKTGDALLKQIAGLLVRPVRSDRPEIARIVATQALHPAKTHVQQG